ncbi:ATP-binding protein [Pedobacter psychroterrae]|nr:sensor histidine kinase [Pedobacter psychroterrae]
MLSLSANGQNLKKITWKLQLIDSLVGAKSIGEAAKEFKQFTATYDTAKLSGKNGRYHFVKALIADNAEGAHNLAMKEYEKSLAIYTAANDLEQVAKVNSNIGNVHIALNQFDEALVYKNKALNYFKNYPEREEYIITIGGIAQIYLNKGAYLKSAQLYMQFLRYYEKKRDTLKIGNAYFRIGLAYDYADMVKQAKAYYLRAVKIREQLKDTVGLMNTYNNLGIVNKNSGKPDSAIYFYNESLRLAALTGMNRYKINPLINLGVVYRQTKQNSKAINYYEQAQAICIAEGKEGQLFTVKNNIGFLYNSLEEFTNALPYTKAAAEFSLQKGTLEDKVEYLQNYAVSLHGLRRSGEAFDMLLKSKVYADSLYDTKNTEQMAELSAKYEDEKKAQLIEILNQETAIQKLQLRQRSIVFASAIVILLGAAFSIYLIQNRRKLKAESRLQQQLYDQQQQATKELLYAEERERRRIATDLHDGVGQMLSAALMKIGEAHNQTEEHSAAWKATEQAKILLTESYDEMRSISHQMMPNALLKAGLASSVKDFLEKIGAGQLKVSLDVVGLDERLDEHTETVLYRVIQEAVNNVVKHADASKLSIQLIRDAEGLSLTIEDNGKGFDKEAMNDLDGIGLNNIRSRIALLGGTVDIDSAIGKGTLLAIHL